jgi:hypothetical protein
MSERDDELELQALQRELDDAFATTRPRRGFDDELWARMQSARPAPNRLRDALAGLWQGIRTIPAVPAAAVAAGLVVVIGIGLLAYSGAGAGPRGGGGAMSAQAPVTKQAGTAGFGKLPSPSFDRAGSAPPLAATNAGQDSGSMQFVWAGSFDFALATAPVYRYDEPTTSDADRFGSSVGAALRGRPEGFLGEYSTSDYTLKVRGTIASPVSSPAYFIFASSAMPPVNAAGASPDDLAREFLAEHNLTPDWSFAVTVDSRGDPVRVIFARQFGVGGYGSANLVDYNGTRYGLEVDLSANRPVLAAGVLPVPLKASSYTIVSPRQAITPVLAPPTVAGSSPAPTAVLTQVELVYVLVPAGDHSFYEPAYLFSGKVQVGGATYPKNLLVPAVDPSQRNP